MLESENWNKCKTLYSDTLQCIELHGVLVEKTDNIKFYFWQRKCYAQYEFQISH